MRGCSSLAGSALVALAYQPIEQPDTPAGRALGHGGCVFLRPGDPGDVEMRPWHVVDEALAELRADDAAGVAVADILDVGNVGIDQLVVSLGERHAPYRLARHLAGFEQCVG